MTVKNYQSGGPSGRGKSSKSYTFKVSDKDAKGEKRVRGYTVRCGHNDDRGICAVAQSLVRTANARLRDSGAEDDTALANERSPLDAEGAALVRAADRRRRRKSQKERGLSRKGRPK